MSIFNLTLELWAFDAHKSISGFLYKITIAELHRRAHTTLSF